VKKVLLSTDFSENAWNSSLYALQLLKDTRCTFYVVHTYTPTPASGRIVLNATNNTTAALKAKQQLSSLIRKLKQHGSHTNHSFVAIVSFSILTNQILASIEKEAIDLLVIGAKGSSENAEKTFGNNTKHIISLALPCPTLIVPKFYSYPTIKIIGFALNFKRFYEVSELEAFKKAIRKFRASTCLLEPLKKVDYSSQIQQENLKILQKYLGKTAPARAIDLIVFPNEIDSLAYLLHTALKGSRHLEIAKTPLFILPKKTHHKKQEAS